MEMNTKKRLDSMVVKDLKKPTKLEIILNYKVDELRQRADSIGLVGKKREKWFEKTFSKWLIKMGITKDLTEEELWGVGVKKVKKVKKDVKGSE